MHANVLEEVGLCGTGISINYKSIRWRFQHNVSRTKRGPAPPAEAIEAYLITIAAWKQDIGEPMDKEETIDLANSMIMGSKLQAAVEKHHQISQVQPTRLLGDQWYANYKRRHKEVLDTGKGTRQHSVRREWCTYQNFEDMYGGGCLLNGDCLVERRRRDDISIQKVMNAIDKTANMYKDRLEIYQALVDKGDGDKQTVAALRLWLQVRVKPKSGGVKIPTHRPTLLELKAKYAHSVPLTLSEYLIDAKPKDKALVLVYLSRLQQPADGEATGMEGLNEDFAQLPSADI